MRVINFANPISPAHNGSVSAAGQGGGRRIQRRRLAVPDFFESLDFGTQPGA